MSAADKSAVTAILHGTPEFLPGEVAVAGELIDAYLEDPEGSGYYTVVAEADEQVAGYACYGPTPLTEGTWDLYWIAVEHHQQGQGIGRALMKYVEERVKEKRGRMLLIETSSKPDYKKTRDFYISIGYQVICVIPDFYAVGDDRVEFWKRL
jgi:GNAT superfamily N-acetyltransferase